MSEAILSIVGAVVVLLGIEVFRWVRRPESRRLRMIRKIGKRPPAPFTRVIGTSGSTDYLSDHTGDKRYWMVQGPGLGVPPNQPQLRAEQYGQPVGTVSTASPQMGPTPGMQRGQQFGMGPSLVALGTPGAVSDALSTQSPANGLALPNPGQGPTLLGVTPPHGPEDLAFPHTHVDDRRDAEME